MGPWIRTDGLQIVRQIDSRIFELAEIQLVEPPEKYVVVKTEIDLNDYSEEDILDYIQGYGYKSIADVEKQYGETANQVVAECIFECLQLIDYSFVSSPYSSQESAEALLRAIEGKPL